LLTSSTPPTLLERVIASGVMPVISFNGPSTFYDGTLGTTRFDYALAYGIAQQLCVELAIIARANPEVILQSVINLDGIFAAASHYG